MKGFNGALGRKGKTLLSGEEILIQEHLIKERYSCLYNPNIRIQHAVLPHRLTQLWIYERMAGEGISQAMIKIHRESISKFKRYTTALWEIVKFIVMLRPLSYLLPSKNPFVFGQRCLAIRKVNYILYMLNQTDRIKNFGNYASI